MKVNEKLYIIFIQIFFSSVFLITTVLTFRGNADLNNLLFEQNKTDASVITINENESETLINIENIDENESKSNKESSENDEKKEVAVMAEIDINSSITVPVHGEITSGFGGRTNPITGLYSEHSGVDIAAKKGTDILAAYNGIVDETGQTEKAGNYVLLMHSDGSETLYCHCSEICCSDGDLVKAGDVIAKVGSTGWSTGPHLHFEVRIDGESVDPLDYLEEKDGCV